MGSLCDTNQSSSQQSQWVSIHRSSSPPPRTPECPRDAFPSWGEEPRSCMVWSWRPDEKYTHDTCRRRCTSYLDHVKERAQTPRACAPWGIFGLCARTYTIHPPGKPELLSNP